MFSFLGLTSTPRVNANPSGNNDSTKFPTDSSEDAPIFPAPNSIQRASSASSTPSIQVSAPDDEESEDDEGSEELRGSYHLDISDIDTLPPPMSTLVKPPVPRKKVRLQPGFSQLDWAKLKTSGANLRGQDIFTIRRITPEELSQHNKKEDAWSSFHGRVYNITPYLNYHPGGPRELMRVAGKDGTELFMKTHAWVSADAMMDSCMVGFLVNH